MKIRAHIRTPGILSEAELKTYVFLLIAGAIVIVGILILVK